MKFSWQIATFLPAATKSVGQSFCSMIAEPIFASSVAFPPVPTIRPTPLPSFKALVSADKSPTFEFSQT